MNRLKGITGAHGALDHLKKLNAKMESLEKEIENLEHTEENVIVQLDLIDEINDVYEEYQEWLYYYEEIGMVFDRRKAELI